VRRPTTKSRIAPHTRACRSHRCGVTLLAGKVVGAPFVGATAATLAQGEVLRPPHAGAMNELIDFALKAPEYRGLVLTTQDFSTLRGDLL